MPTSSRTHHNNGGDLAVIGLILVTAVFDSQKSKTFMKMRHSYAPLLIFFLFVRALAVADLSVRPKPATEINGVVVDWQDARIVNASVVIEGNNFRSATASNELGEFRVVMPVGTYKLTVSHPIFKTYVIKKLRVLESNNAVLKITMKVKSATSGGKCPKGHICL